jgi:subtilisin family serine protease
MGPLKQIKLKSLMALPTGNPKLTVGIIDGLVDTKHQAFSKTQIINVNKSNSISCTSAHTDSVACIHGTFITGVLAAKRGVDAPSICPSCRFALRPIFFEHSHFGPRSTAKDLSDAIIETVQAGAKIINLSLGMEVPVGPVKDLEDACIYARSNDVIIIISAGNQHRVGGFSVLNNEWPIQVAACDQNNNPLVHSNLGISIRKYGVMAPGSAIRSTFPNNSYNYMTGTSVSAALVTGTVALLWSLFPESSSAEIIYSVRKSSTKSIVPAVLDGESAFKILNKVSR